VALLNVGGVLSFRIWFPVAGKFSKCGNFQYAGMRLRAIFHVRITPCVVPAQAGIHFLNVEGFFYPLKKTHSSPIAKSVLKTAYKIAQ